MSSDSTGDDIKYMIDLATKELAYHKTQVTQWEQTLSRLQRTQQNHITQQNANATQIQSLELELAKAKTTGAAASTVSSSSSAVNKTSQVNTTFNTPLANRPAFSSRPSLVAIQQNHNHQQVLSGQQQQQQAQLRQAQSQVQVSAKPKLIARVLYNFAGIPENNVMALTADEYLIINNTEGDWYMCQRTYDKVEPYGQQQFAPRNYLQLVEIDDELPPSAPKVTNMTVRAAKTPTMGHSTLTALQSQSVQQHLEQQLAGQQTHPPPPQHQQPSQAQQPVQHHPPPPLHQQQHHQPPPPQQQQQQQQQSQSWSPSVVPSPSSSLSSSNPLGSSQSGGAARGPPPFRGSVGPTSVHAAAAATAFASSTPSQPQSPANKPTSFAMPSKSGGGGGGGGPPPFQAGGNSVGPPPPPPAGHKSSGPTCTALFDYKVDDPTILSFSRGDVFTIVGDTSGSDWWRVSDSKGNMGYIPSNYVKKNQ